MVRTTAKLWQHEAGLSTPEYAILLCLVALVALVGWRTLGDVIANSAEGATAVVDNPTG